MKALILKPDNEGPSDTLRQSDCDLTSYDTFTVELALAMVLQDLWKKTVKARGRA